MLGLPILLCLATAGQLPSTPVTYETRAARASVVVKELGAAAKLDLQTTAQTENEVLLISVKDQPIGEVMARIATAASAEWKHEGSTYRLVASETVRRKEDKDSVAKRVVLFQKELKKRAEDEKQQLEAQAKRQKVLDAKAKTTDDQKSQAEDAPSNFPPDGGANDESAITGLLQGVDPEDIAQIEYGDRVVFSTNPTRVQRALGSNAADVVNHLISEHNARVLKIPPEPPRPDDSIGGAMQEAAIRQLKARMAKIGAVAKALLIAKKNDLGTPGQMSLELRLYDGNGVVVYTATSSLAGANNASSAPTESDGGVKGTCTDQGAMVDYSTDSKAFIAMMLTLQSGGLTTTLGASPPLVAKLRSPDKFDPLSYMQTDEIQSYAKTKSLPLVADIPDDWDTSFMNGRVTASMSVSSVANRIKLGDGLVTIQDSAFTVLKPSDPMESRLLRANRVAIAQLIHTVEEKGVPSADDMAAFAAASPDPTPIGVDLLYLVLMVPGGLIETMTGSTQWAMLRFYGNLSPEARQTLAGGGRLAFANLTGTQRSALERLVYGADENLSMDDGKGKTDHLPFLANMSAGTEIGTTFSLEPTEVAPAGLPSDGFFDVKQRSEPFAMPAPDGGGVTIGLLGILGSDELALFDLMKGAGAGGDSGSGIPKIDWIRIGSGVAMDFTFHIAPKVVSRGSLHDRRIDKSASIVTMKDLPADFKAAVDASTEKYKKEGLGGVVGALGGGGGIHP